MKTLTCELCGCTNFIKREGIFSCQECGMNYTLEEAKKLMAEGEISNTASKSTPTDTSRELQNLYELARRARRMENYEGASKYYEMILLKDASSWEANFFSVYSKAMRCTIADIASAANSVGNCIPSTFELIRDHVADDEVRKNAVRDVHQSAVAISELLSTAAKKHYDSLDPSIKSFYIRQLLDNTIASMGITVTACNCLCEMFMDDEAVMNPWGISILKERVEDGVTHPLYLPTIHKYDPSYEIPVKNPEVPPEEPPKEPDVPTEAPPEEPIAEAKPNQTTQSGGGCYVATAVYGSYDCPEVWTLRRYRDEILAETWYGRTFIRTYYAISPTIVRIFGSTKWFNRLWRRKLDKIVSELRAQGFDSTPYHDKKW